METLNSLLNQEGWHGGAVVNTTAVSEPDGSAGGPPVSEPIEPGPPSVDVSVDRLLCDFTQCSDERGRRVMTVQDGSYSSWQQRWRPEHYSLPSFAHVTMNLPHLGEDFHEDFREDFRKDFREDFRKDFRKDFREDFRKDFRKDFREDFPVESGLGHVHAVCVQPQSIGTLLQIRSQIAKWADGRNRVMNFDVQ
ncbi:hypothetical protein F2P81_009964 [Scophthalmus maximus]|uniref:Uncharacterized protein n=1 Tax=Scophthalmus maximus TaxID=52904 RepID=A0A6A4SZ41_SCOMX|nr:hypothetical protein F2P81_009964 [Scophthalmus maximus]